MRKMIRNRCPEQTLQVKIQYYIQLRSSLATMMWSVPHNTFSFFPVITIAEQADACCYIQVNNIPSDGKEQNSDCVDEGREVCIIDPTLQVTQPKTKERIQDIFHGLLNNVSLKEPVRMNIRQRHMWKDV